MKMSIGDPRPVRIEWRYGLTALADKIGVTLPRGMYPKVIPECADWSEKFFFGRVLQIARGDFNDLDDRPGYIRGGVSMLGWAWTERFGLVRPEPVGHPTVLNKQGQVVQSDVYVDRWFELKWTNFDLPDQRQELWPRVTTHHVSEVTDAELVPMSFEGTTQDRGNSLAITIAGSMQANGFRPATFTETLWYAAKYRDELPDGQRIVPWAGYSGGFSEGRQQHYHDGLPFIVCRAGNLQVDMVEFLGQHIQTTRKVEYLAVRL